MKAAIFFFFAVVLSFISKSGADLSYSIQTGRNPNRRMSYSSMNVLQLARKVNKDVNRHYVVRAELTNSEWTSSTSAVTQYLRGFSMPLANGHIRGNLTNIEHVKNAENFAIIRQMKHIKDNKIEKIQMIIEIPRVTAEGEARVTTASDPVPQSFIANIAIENLKCELRSSWSSTNRPILIKASVGAVDYGSMKIRLSNGGGVEEIVIRNDGSLWRAISRLARAKRIVIGQPDQPVKNFLNNILQ